MRIKTLLVGLLALMTVAIGACVPAAQASLAETAAVSAAAEYDKGNPNKGKVLEFDVAEDMFRFVFDESPVFEEDQFPAYGNPFITQGYIYPAGTITCDDDGCTGVNPDGSPEFPDLVLGEWTCRGWFVGDGAHTASGPMVITTQIYNFGEEFGSEMLISGVHPRSVVGLNVPGTFRTSGCGRAHFASPVREVPGTFT